MYDRNWFNFSLNIYIFIRLWLYLSGRRACLICMKSFMGSSVLHKLGMVIHSCNLSSQEVETGVLDVQGPPGLHSKSALSWAT